MPENLTPLRMQRRTRAQVERMGLDLPPESEATEAPRWVVGQYLLPRGTRILEVGPEFTGEPFAYLAHLGGLTRTMIVVCREQGDVEYPAYLRHLRLQAGGDASRITRQVMRPVLDWIEESKTRLRLGDGPADLLREANAHG